MVDHINNTPKINAAQPSSKSAPVQDTSFVRDITGNVLKAAAASFTANLVDNMFGFGKVKSDFKLLTHA